MHLLSKKDLSADGISLLVGAGILMVLILGLVVTVLSAPGEQTYLLAMFDNRGQQMAYRVFLALVGLLAVVAWYCKPSLSAVSVPG